MKLSFEHKPIYDPHRTSLYTQPDLRSGYQPGSMSSFDERVYCRFLEDGPLRTTAEEALSRRLHDYGIDMALTTYLQAKESAGLRLVGIMGGASKARTDEYYKRVARTALLLTQ